MSCLLSAVAGGCDAAAPSAPAGLALRPTRGYVVISLDTLRADHLGCYGYSRPTSPFLDRLAESAVLFERAVVQYPSTLVSHMSMFTGYYPQQHGVLPPAAVLSPEIETLPERFRAAGFRTSGHTEGGFMAGAYGFARGFEEFTDTPYSRDEDVERTFGRGLRFLAGLGPEERFLLFLHTYSIHDPYRPPPAYRHAFWPGEPPPAFAPDGEQLNAVNLGLRDIDDVTAAYFEALYDGSILYVDSVLRSFFGEVQRLGLRDETTFVITSDHGEEFLEHGRLVHEQVYPENLLVPLVVVHPDIDRGRRVGSLVESIDLAPTLYDLAGLDPVAGLSGRSLVPLIADPAAPFRREAYAEVAAAQAQKTVLVERQGKVLQLVLSERVPEPDGTWVTRRVDFDTEAERLDLRLIAFQRPRQLRIWVNGVEHGEVRVPNRWRPFQFDLRRRPGGNRVTFGAADCDAAGDTGAGRRRCLAIKVGGVEMRRSELFDLGLDPGAQRDLSRQFPDVHHSLHAVLRRYRFTPVAASPQRRLESETVKALEALGYLQ